MRSGQGGISGLHRGGRMFGGLWLQGYTDGSSVRNIFEGSCTEEVTVAIKDIFEGGFTFVPSEVRNNLYSTAS